MKLSHHPFTIFYFSLFFVNPTLANSSLSDELNNECNQPKAAWIWCDDFEIDRSSDYFEGSTDRQATRGINNSIAAAFHYIEGVAQAGSIKVAFGRTPNYYFKAVDDGTQNYQEIYWRMFVFIPSDWIGNGAYKLSRATIIATDNWQQAMIAHVWSGSDPGSQSSLLFIDPASGVDNNGNLVTTQYNDFNNLRWLGKKPSSSSVFAAENFGKWQCIEAHVKLNDSNASNGVFQLSINGNIEVESTNLNWVSSYNDYGINAVFFENYWNRGSPATQTRYFDNLVISTEPIGCGTNSFQVRPKPPTNFKT